MRIALVATSAAAAVAVPFAMHATAPEMSPDQFLTAVRCAAYADVLAPDAQLAEVKWALNAEARRQPADTAAMAAAEVDAIALKAVSIQTPAEADMLRRERAAACSGGQFATGAESADAV